VPRLRQSFDATDQRQRAKQAIDRVTRESDHLARLGGIMRRAIVRRLDHPGELTEREMETLRSDARAIYSRGVLLVRRSRAAGRLALAVLGVTG